MPSTQKAVEQLGKMVEAFSSKEFPDAVKAAYLRPKVGRPSDSWSVSNRLFMAIAKTGDARGYRQWQEVGRQVQKGAKALYILAPNVVRRAVKDGDGNDTDEEREFVTGFRCVPVFRYEDTEGDELELDGTPAGPPPLLDVAKRWGTDVRYCTTSGGEQGSYSEGEGLIRLCNADPATFFHELAHLAHGRIEPLKPGQDPEQETVAELTAAVLARMYGHDSDANSWHYIAGYAKARTPEEVGKACMRVLAKVEGVLDLILADPDGDGPESQAESQAEARAKAEAKAAPVAVTATVGTGA